MRELIVLWILAAMNALAPAHRTHFERAAQESYAQADQRYREIAEAIVDESFAGKPLFGGKGARISTAMLVTTLFFMESGFRRDIDLGTSTVQQRRAGLNDFGRSWCMGQINLGIKRIPDPDRQGMWKDTSAKQTAQGWTGPELLADRRKCVRATIEAVRTSFGACGSLPFGQRLAAYAAGTCESQEGRQKSEQRLRLFTRWNGRGRPAVTDEQVLNEQKETDTDERARMGTGTTTHVAGVL